MYSQIDYGGAEIDDTHDARNWAVENLPFVDASRVGIFGWPGSSRARRWS